MDKTLTGVNGPLHFVIELNTDISLLIKHFILQVRLGLKDEALTTIREVLWQHLLFFPVFAEIISFFVEEERLHDLQSVLELLHQQNYTAFFAPDEIRLVQCFNPIREVEVTTASSWANVPARQRKLLVEGLDGLGIGSSPVEVQSTLIRLYVLAANGPFAEVLREARKVFGKLRNTTNKWEATQAFTTLCNKATHASATLPAWRMFPDIYDFYAQTADLCGIDDSSPDILGGKVNDVPQKLCQLAATVAFISVLNSFNARGFLADGLNVWKLVDSSRKALSLLLQLLPDSTARGKYWEVLDQYRARSNPPTRPQSPAGSLLSEPLVHPSTLSSSVPLVLGVATVADSEHRSLARDMKNMKYLRPSPHNGSDQRFSQSGIVMIWEMDGAGEISAKASIEKPELTVLAENFQQQHAKLERIIEQEAKESEDIADVFGDKPAEIQLPQGNMGEMLDTPGYKSTLPNEIPTKQTSFFTRNYELQRSSWFRVGRVFRIWFAEPRGVTSKATDENDYLIKGIARSFVTVRRNETHCICLPIFSYQRQGIAKKGLTESERKVHAIIHDADSEPVLLEAEKCLGSLMFKPFSVTLAPGGSLTTSDRVRFDQPTVIDYGKKVRDVGLIRGDDQRARLWECLKQACGL